MKSFSIFKIFGIRIDVHPTFFLLPLGFGIFYAKDYGWEIGLRVCVLIFLVFLCVLGHELTHSLKAMSFGIRVPQITLYPMGGVASLQRIPRDPHQEFSISIVGPLFNFALAAILFFPLYFCIGKENLFSPSLESWPRTFANLFWLNPILGLFNLIPAFPMDGGRIFRSLLARRMDYVKATRISVFLGVIFAILFSLLALYWKHAMLFLVALFVYFSGAREKSQVLREEALKKRLETHESTS